MPESTPAPCGRRDKNLRDDIAKRHSRVPRVEIGAQSMALTWFHVATGESVIDNGTWPALGEQLDNDATLQVSISFDGMDVCIHHSAQ